MLANITSIPKALYNRLWPERTVQCSSDLLYLTQFHSKTKSNISLMIFIPPKLLSMNLASINRRPLLNSRFIYPQYQDSDLVIIQTLDPASYLRWQYMTTKTWYIPTIPLDQPATSLRHLCIDSPFKLRRRLGFVPTSHFSLSINKIHYNFLQHSAYKNKKKTARESAYIHSNASLGWWNEV